MADIVMSNTTIGIALTCFFGVALIWAWRFLNWAWFKPKRLEKCLREQGFKGNPYRFLVGDLKDIYQMTEEAKAKPIGLFADPVPRILPFIHKTMKTYGKNSFTWVGRTPRVHIMEPDMIKDVLSNYLNFQKNHHGYDPLTKFVLGGIGSYEGDQWAKHRKIITPAFHLEKLKHMLPAFNLSCGDMMSTWEKVVSEKGGACELDVWPYLEMLASDVISRTAFGSSYEEGRRIFLLQKEQLEHVLDLIHSVYIPGWSYLPTKRNTRMRAIDKEVETLLVGMISKRTEAIKSGENEHDDLLSVLLKFHIQSSQQNESNKINGVLSTAEVIEEVKLFYFAGQESTAIAMMWAMVLLAMHPDWQARAREEVLQVFGQSKPHFDGLNHLKVLTMIVYEVLRLYPPVVELTKTTQKDTKLGNLSIPAGVQVMLPTMILHRDCDVWGPDAEEFNPERFADGVAAATKGKLVFFPFSNGPRNCVGQNFALLEVKMTLAVTLQRFALEISPSYAHSPYTVLTLQPQHGAPMFLRKL